MEEKGKISIIGSGLIGSCWATLFASGGYRVCMYDIDESQLDKAKGVVKKNLEKLEHEGLSRGTLPVEVALSYVSSTTNLKECLSNAIYAQESTCEDMKFKINIFAEMDRLASSSTILASSTSSIPASKFTEQLINRSRCLVAHPVNPPLYLPLVEVVPAPWTDVAVIDRTCEILKGIGQEPVRFNFEVLGFAVNRLQYALLAEAWRLVDKRVLSPQDIDRVMSAGLGPRYAFYGPFQTIHLNANGVRDYCDRYSAGICTVLADLGPIPTFQEDSVLNMLEQALSTQMPVDQLPHHKAQRERNLASICELKK